MNFKPQRADGSWQLIVSVVDDNGGWEAIYDSSMTGAHNPDYACGFALGWAAAHGVSPEMIAARLVVQEEPK